MSKIVDIKEIEPREWKDLSRISPVSTWFQTQEAFEFYDGLPFLEAFAVGVENDGRLKGLAVGFVQKDGGWLKRFFSRRAIVIGGPLLSCDISNEELSMLLVAVKDKLKKKSIYIETRNLNDYSRWRGVFEQCGFVYEPHLNYKVKCQPKDEVWKNLKENRRRQIKKALAEGTKIEEAASEKEVMKYYELLDDLYRRKVKTPLFPKEFFLEFYRKECGKFLLVKTEKNEIIGGIMCPVLHGKTIYEFFVCGNDSTNKTNYPSVMATWAAMDYASNNNIEVFDFMGAGKPNEEYGVREFKSKFGGELVENGRFGFVCKPVLFVIGKFGVKMIKKL